MICIYKHSITAQNYQETLLLENQLKQGSKIQQFWAISEQKKKKKQNLKALQTDPRKRIKSALMEEKSRNPSVQEG